MSFVIYADMLSLGLGPALVRYTSANRVSGKGFGVNQLISTVFIVYSMAGIFCCVVFWWISPYAVYWVLPDATTQQGTSGELACSLLGFQLFFAFISNAYGGVLHGYSRFDLANLSLLSKQVLRFALIWFFVAEPFALLRLGIIVCIAEIVAFIVIAVTTYRTIPSLRIRPRQFSPAVLKTLFGFGFYAFLIIAAIKIIGQMDILIIGAMLGSVLAAYYSIPLQMMDYGYQAMDGMAKVFMPKFTEFHSQGQHEAVRRLFLDGYRMFFIIVVLLTVSLLFIGKSFIAAWVGDEFAHAVWFVLPVLGIVFCLRAYALQFTLVVFEAKKFLKLPALVLISEAGLNLVLSLILVRLFGIEGVAVATLIAILAIEVTVLPVLVCRVVNVPYLEFLQSGVIPGLLLAVILSAFYLTVGHMWPAIGFLGVFGYGVGGIIFALPWVILLSPSSIRQMVVVEFHRILISRSFCWKKAVP